MKLVEDKNGRTMLHLWRTGTSFEYTNRFHLYRDWNNVKFSTIPHADELPYIRYLELRNPLPFMENQFDAIYCNHVLEHLTIEDGKKLCQELFRVLKPGGICRAVVPDLESLAVDYLQTIEKIQNNPSSNNILQYEWAVAHLIDQMIRLKTGGEMGKKLLTDQVDWDQIKRTMGDVFDKIRANNKIQSLEWKVNPIQKRIINFYLENGFFDTIKKVMHHIKSEIYIKFSSKSRVELYNEKVLWMYDRFSLTKLLQDSNFKKVKLMNYKTSRIEDWDYYNFDKSENGDYPLEPSVYLEGIKI